MPYERRVQIVQATLETILEYNKEGVRPATKVTSWPWPSDAKVVSIRQNPFIDVVEFLVHSDSFPVISEGFIPPTLSHVPWVQELPHTTLYKYQCAADATHIFYIGKDFDMAVNSRMASCPWGCGYVAVKNIADEDWQKLTDA